MRKNMKAKISRLAKGIFDKHVPELELSIRNITGTISSDSVLRNSFLIRSEKETKGVLYTDTSRIVLKETSFIGTYAEIHYEIHGNGAAAGSKIKGFILIVSDGGEIAIPCEVQVEAPYAMTSMGKIRNLFHFANLAKNYYEEAKRLFFSSDFADIFLTGNPYARAVYEGLKKSSCQDTAIEEFLVSVNKKARILLSLDRDRLEYVDFKASLGSSITITKSGWGYLAVEIEIDGEFLHIDKKKFTSEDFSGSIYQLFYTIEEDKVHIGKNMGRIYIKTPYQQFSVEILVKRNRPVLQQGRAEQKRALIQLTKQYFDFRMNRQSAESFCKRSLKVLERLKSSGEPPLFLEVFRIQLLIIQKKNKEAGLLLQQLEDKVLRLKEEQAALYAYYQYVRVLYFRDSQILKETLRVIKRLYEEGQDIWQVLWVLLYLDEEYVQNTSLKLARLKEQYTKGARSPFLYYEACAVMNEQPELIRVLNGFELQAVYWGARQRFLTEKAGIRIAGLSQLEKHGTSVLYQILELLYEQYKSKIILESLLSLLIRDSRMEKAYFPWYEKGVLAQCTLTGLYEAYLDTLPDSYYAPIPKMAAMYFVFDNNLSTYAKEKLYENLLRYEQGNVAVLQNHMPAIEAYVLQQIEQDNINRKLAYIYKKVVKSSMLTPTIAEHYPRILLSYYGILEKQGHIIVRHKEYKEEISVQIKDGSFCIPFYTEDIAVFYEDEWGRRFLLPQNIEVAPLFYEEAMVHRCYEMCQGDILLWLHICEKEGIYHVGKEMELYRHVLDSPFIWQYYKNQICQKMIEYYMENYDGDKLEEQLRQFDMSGMPPKERCKIQELLIARAMYEEAYKELKHYGYEEISVNRLMKLCVYLLWSREGSEDTFLLELCAYVFSKGKYDETILRYLLKHYSGTTKNMLKLWQAAQDFTVDAVDLEERLIVQMLFSGSYVARIMDVFEDYYKNSMNQMVISAYLAQQSYGYFVQNLVVHEKIFHYIERECHQHKKEVPDICKMALLRYYSEKEGLSELQIWMAKKLVQEFLEENKRFAFYKKFERYMELPAYLRDKTIVEYQSNTENTVEIHYMLDTGFSGRKVYEIRKMEKSYAAYYIMEFILFYGERLQYYIAECGPESELLTESDTVFINRFETAEAESRYDLLNDICACMELHDTITLKELMQSYAEKKKLTEECFALL